MTPSPPSEVGSGRRVLRQYASVTAGYAGSAVIRAVGLIVLARLALPADFGLFSAVAGVIVIAQAALDLGLARLILREHGGGEAARVVRSALRLNIALSTVLGVVGLTGLALVGTLVDGRILFLLPLAVAAAAEKNADTSLSVAIAEGRGDVNTVNLIARRMLALSVFLCLALTGLVEATLLAYACGEAVSALFAAVLARRQIRGSVPDGPPLPYRRTARLGAPFWINSLATQTRNLDVLLITSIAGSTQGGFYASATRLTGPLQLLASSAATVLLPVAARSARRSRVFLAALVVSGLMALVYALLAALAPFFVPLLLGDAYVPAVPVIQIVLAGLPFACLSAVLASALQGWRRADVVATTAVLFTVVCLGGAIVGGVATGAAGAALGLALAYLLQAGILTTVAAREARRSAPTRGTE